ncbi:malto-oligosyltrehalose trehalohydrolase [Gleimia europaea]|uniref:Malto-oligosyltrehalose trehalohydrolase n=1 Tax=Gleimia europaea ACS-120-V-Col10b TaxID=883069 RepID=A0A9W5RDK5_9ACTO|nr:malto-oligosyltrehalose trehalohydrolase [Gleimia europaea]EPD30407.1 malto-oligosyltrehalose trehalohydrolase [Gleimia europaea ACS-120-V-Col10b]
MSIPKNFVDTPGRDLVPVWSSTAKSITVHYEFEGTHELEMKNYGGWWVSPSPLPPGATYRYSVDGGAPVADPRALRRPAGVHGPAQTWQPPKIKHFDAGDLLGKVFMEIHIGTFTPEGTLEAAAHKLGHLADLGVQVVEVMPVAPFPGTFGWGYDGVSLYAVHEAYGGPDGFVHFVEAAHDLGIAVCLDLVLNHFGPVGNYIAALDNYYSSKHETPWGAALDLDGDNAVHTREFLKGAALHWLRNMGVDALRLDAVHALDDDSSYHFLAELSDDVAKLEAQTGRTFTLIAESDLNDPIMVTPTDKGGRGMDAQWDDDVHHALHAAFTGETHGYYADFEPREALVAAFEDVFFHAGTYSSFRGKMWGAPVSKDIDRRRFVISSQNHDQVGNRAIGDRPSQVLSDAQLGSVAALVLLSSFTPMLFQGEEWASRSPFLFFSDQEGDEEMARAMRDGRRAEFASHGFDSIYGRKVTVPDPTVRSTFAASKLDWQTAQCEAGKRMLAWYKKLIQIRKEEATTGKPMQVRFDEDLLRMRSGHLEVIVNMGASTARPAVGEKQRLILTWSGNAGDLQPGEAAIYNS